MHVHVARLIEKQRKSTKQRASTVHLACIAKELETSIQLTTVQQDGIAVVAPQSSSLPEVNEI